MRHYLIASFILIAGFVPGPGVAKETLAPAPPPRYDVVTDDKAVATIVLPAEPDRLERYAAEELQKYVRAISGATLPIVCEPQQPAGYGIWLGRTAAAEAAGFTLTEEKLGRDGYAARAGAKGLVLVGRCPLGTLFGVYDIIEREFGVRWCVPDEYEIMRGGLPLPGGGRAPYTVTAEKSDVEGEVVPTARSLSIGTFQREFKPSFEYRWVRRGDWALKQRMNLDIRVDGKEVGVLLNPPEYRNYGFHTFCFLFPPEEYYDDHPEWFALVNGQRQGPVKIEKMNGPNLCTSNPEVVRKMAERVIEAIEADPTMEIIGFSPNDTSAVCQCPRCKALDEPGRPWHGRDTNRLVSFYNQVAQIVGRRYPDVKLAIGAYENHTLPPETEGFRLEPNQLVFLTHSKFCHNHPIAGGQCKEGRTYQPHPVYLPNQEFAKVTERWVSLGEVMIYEYYTLSAWGATKTLWPMVHTMRHDIPWYRDVGVKGFFTQCAQARWYRCPLNHYIAAKLVWNADLDVDWLIDDFCEKFFEEAAEPMKRYLLGIEEVFVRNDQCISSYLPTGTPEALRAKLFDKPTCDRLRGYLEDAARRAKNDTVRARIAAIRRGLEDSSHPVEFDGEF